VKIRIVNQSHHPLPEYSSPQAAGMDIRAFLPSPLILKPFQRVLVPTGLFIELPAGTEAQIRPRSGLAVKHGITVLNSPGTIDSDYRGEVRVILINLGDEDFILQDGDRICQMVVAKHENADWAEVDVLGDTSRGEGGFGSTGKA
jgi:dUTP pyrophosphatase